MALLRIFVLIMPCHFCRKMKTGVRKSYLIMVPISLLFLLCMWTLAGLYVFSVVQTADFCFDVDGSMESATLDDDFTTQQQVEYFLTCERPEENAAYSVIFLGHDELANGAAVYKEMLQTADAYCPELSIRDDGATFETQDALNGAKENIDGILSSLNCTGIQTNIRQGLNSGLCDTYILAKTKCQLGILMSSVLLFVGILLGPDGTKLRGVDADRLDRED